MIKFSLLPMQGCTLPYDSGKYVSWKIFRLVYAVSGKPPNTHLYGFAMVRLK
jgi:hypothetical protein